MNKDEIKKLLDKTEIYVLDEINILEYINGLIQIKMEYFKSLDKLDVLDNRIDKAIDYMELKTIVHKTYCLDRDEMKVLLDILRGKDEERNNRNTIKKSNL